MTDFFKSALGGIIGSGPSQGNDFVGQFVELGNQKLRVKRVIAEGGFGFVFVTQDNNSGKEYALKRLLANDEEKNKAVLQEIQFLKKLSGHPNIINFIAAAAISKEQSDHGQSEYLILTELCTGQLIDELNRPSRALPFELVLQIFYQTCRAVQHMHKQDPPVIHRDLKAENLLISTKGTIKLCDFGSATTATHKPDTSWSALKRSLVEDEITKNTTPMYRSPEMLDLYQNFPINEACDVWALGCLLFKLCFVEHPFEDSAKLRIINANYVIPDSDTDSELFHDLIRGMLTVNPEQRPTINDIIDRLQEIAEARNINPREPLPFSRMSNNSSTEPPRSSYNQASSSTQPSEGGFGAAGSLFNSLKGGAGSVFRNIKDASSKVMETVSNTINRPDLDISNVTSRILVMSYPAEGVESAIKNDIEDVRAYLENRHRGSYAVYNLSQRSYRVARFENRVSECGWPQKKAPPLTNLYAICKNMHLWLRQKPRNVCVVHCLDGKANSACVVGAFMVFCRLFDNCSAAMHLFTARRAQPGISPSQARYINYIGQMVSDEPLLPHFRPVLLKSMSLRPVPLFNKMKNGCTPFVEIFIGEERVLSTSQDYDRMCQYTLEDGAALIPLNTSVCGDVTVIAYHARSTFGGKLQGKITSMKIFQLQFHTGFIQEGATNVKFHQYELDQLDTADKYPESFTVSLELVVSPKEKNQSGRKLPWENFPVEKLTPKILFSSKDEIHQTFSEYGVSDRAKSRMSRASSFDTSPTDSPVKRPSEPQSQSQPQPTQQNHTEKAKSAGSSTFFATLDWQAGENGEKPVEQPTESQVGLLNDDSEDDTDFANFSQQRNDGDVPQGNGLIDDEGKKEQPNKNDKPQQNFFNAQFEEQNSNSSSQPEEVDLLNMNSTKSSSAQSVTDGVDLLNIGGDPSNVDLLSGHAVGKPTPDTRNSSEPDLLGMTTEQGSFDAFSQFAESTPTTQAPQPDLMTSNNAPASDDTFDPFKNFGSSSQPSQTNVNVTPPQQNKSGGIDDDFFAFMQSSSTSKESKEDDLMTSWDTNNIQAFSSQSPSHSANNLKPAPGGIHKSASTGSAMNFQSMMGGQNSPSLNTMGGRNSPSMSSGMGMAGSSGMGSNVGAVPKADPFADFGSLGKTSFTSQGQFGNQQKAPTSGMKPSLAGMQGRSQQPSQPMYGGKPGFQQQQQQRPQQQSSPQHRPQQQQQQQQAFQKPNYSSSIIGDREERGLRKNFVSGANVAANSTKQGLMDDTLNELLKEHKFTSKKDEPKTLGDMRKKQLEEDMDPDKLKVMEWTTGKEKNIRALICSLGQILWDGEARWRPVGMHELVSADQVKKWWRKAVLCVHPDKLTDDPNQPLAQLIFMELNDAWAKFEEDGSKSLY